MIFANKNSVKKIIHVKDCLYLKNKKQKNIIVFSDMRDAFKNGYTLCKKCNPIKKQYFKEEALVTNFAKANKLKVELREQEINIQSNQEQWKIVVACDGYGITLYHKNTDNRHSDNYVPNYHLQVVEKESIVGYLEYIVKHDDCKIKNAHKQEAMICVRKNHHKNKTKKTKPSTNGNNNVLALLKSLHKEDVYKDFLCYITG